VEQINSKKIFGASIKHWRSQRGYSQELLAEKAGLHRTYVSDVERGSRNLSLESITRLAGALEVSVSALFPEELVMGRAHESRRSGRDGKFVDILLVEDNADDVELTLRAFRQARFANRVHVVSNGQEALDYLFFRGRFSRRSPSEHPQVVLLDLDLPKVNGLEVLRRLKSDPQTAAMPVVILTVCDDDYNMAECRRIGADNYIVKPVNLPRLVQATPRLNLEWMLVKPMKKTARKAAP
jgi:CheY-like chemotaxis protein/predicted XRE-type DNA-binding protein